MKAKKGKVTINERRVFFIAFHGRPIDAHWNGFPSFRAAQKYYNDYMVRLGASLLSRGYGILQRDIKDTHTEFI